MDNKYIECTSPKPNTLTKTVTVALGAAAIALFVITNADGLLFRWAYQFAAIVMLTAAAFTAQKFMLSGYRYIFDGESFIVKKLNGKREVEIASVNISTAKGLIGANNYSRVTELYGATQISFNYCGSIAPASPMWFIFDFNDKRCTLKFEPTIEFVREFSAALSSVNN
ncbi:hypothetical protein FACS1894219_02430 [Clostridia bacterium]|nr:hypothetical protein FACS1894219_02430 [Clostridia bacterium]